MARDRNISAIVWPENRDQVFLQWLIEDITALQEAGFSVKEIKKMLGSLDYVKIWAANPSWLFPITGLPKGFRWRAMRLLLSWLCMDNPAIPSLKAPSIHFGIHRGSGYLLIPVLFAPCAASW